ncbi:hypothetical protein Tco_0991443 [Tanacetum coccineum]|uniref:Uncharacterized protein n=1 Tax=Tanacetum coccineum TaxID=301880 RepID=A0ABQ5F0C2_9ASTR
MNQRVTLEMTLMMGVRLQLGHSQGVMDFINGVGDASDDDVDEKVRIDIWSQLENKIRLEMQFESRKQVKKVVTLWSNANNKEYKVLESKSHKYVAQCKGVHRDKTESSSTAECTPNCAWYIRAVKKKIHHMWKSSCGWQMEMFPCSNALVVYCLRGDNPRTISHTVYTTATFKQQYRLDFTQLPHVYYWSDSGWKIKADNSKISVGRGRKKSSRICNEMDIRHPDELKRCGDNSESLRCWPYLGPKVMETLRIIQPIKGTQLSSIQGPSNKFT